MIYRARFLLATALVLAACTPARRAATPQMSGAIRAATDVTETIDLAREDSKEVKNLHRQSLGLLDRLDYKTTILLR
jgi:hypothetical protein